MPLIIKGDMPKGCCWGGEHPGFCQFSPICDAFANKTSLRSVFNKRLKTCPIIGEIPDIHGRLGDLDKLQKKVEDCAFVPEQSKTMYMMAVEKEIRDAPTLVEATE